MRGRRWLDDSVSHMPRQWVPGVLGPSGSKSLLCTPVPIIAPTWLMEVNAAVEEVEGGMRADMTCLFITFGSIHHSGIGGYHTCTYDYFCKVRPVTFMCAPFSRSLLLNCVSPDFHCLCGVLLVQRQRYVSLALLCSFSSFMPVPTVFIEPLQRVLNWNRNYTKRNSTSLLTIN